MRDIANSISVSVGGNSMDFRLTRLDAFSGAALLRILSSLPSGALLSEGERSDPQPPALSLFRSLSESDLRSLMITCLQHCEVLL